VLAIALPAVAMAQGSPPAGRDRPGQVPFDFASATLDRQELIAAVLASNTDLAAARWAVEGARARAREVRELPNLTASYGFAPASPFVSDARYGQVAQVSQTLPWPGTLARRGEEADALADARDGDLETLRRDLTLIASQAFDDYQYVERALAINGEHRELLREFQEVATARYAAGLAPQQAPLAAELEVAQLEHRDIVLATDRQALLAYVNALLHREPRAPIPPPSAAPPSIPEPSGAPLRELIQIALARRPEVSSARARVLAGETGVQLAQLEGRPAFQPMTSFNSMWGPGAYRWTVTLGVSLPIWRDRIRAGVARAESALSEQRERLVALQDRIAADVSTAADRFEESRHVLALYEARLVPAARDQTAAARIAFETGQVDFLAVIEAERRMRDIELGLAASRADALRRFATLQRALGAWPGDPWPPRTPSLHSEDSGFPGAIVPQGTPRRRTP
jgi:outer membrane protein TolC